MNSTSSPPPMTPPPALPSGSRTPKSPTTKEFFFGTLGKLTRQPSVKQEEKKIARSLNQESIRVRETEVDKGATVPLHPEAYLLEEGEERTYLDPISQQMPEVQEVISNVTSWINEVLGESKTRIKIDNLEQDLFDGLVLKVLAEELSGAAIPMPAGEFVQSEERQRINLAAVIGRIEEILKATEAEKQGWSVKSVYEKNLLSTLRLLLCLICRYSAEGKVLIDLPKSLKVGTIQVRKIESNLKVEMGTENLISGYLTTRDGFDTLIDHAPEKLQFVQKSLLQFANIHLGKVNRSVESLEEDFRDGVNLLILIGVMEGFFIPLYLYDRSPTTLESKTANVTLAFEFLASLGIRPKNRPADVVRGDLKSVLRIIYCLFVKFKGQQNQMGEEEVEEEGGKGEKEKSQGSLGIVKGLS